MNTSPRSTAGCFGTAWMKRIWKANGHLNTPKQFSRFLCSITDIGEGTKGEDDDKIGSFGVGFKAVFAYSETPSIYSPSYSFKITDLVLPTEIPAASDLSGKTRFEFPFNNPKKILQEAHSECRRDWNNWRKQHYSSSRISNRLTGG